MKSCSAFMHTATANAGLHGEPIGMPRVCLNVLLPNVKYAFCTSNVSKDLLDGVQSHNGAQLLRFALVWPANFGSF